MVSWQLVYTTYTFVEFWWQNSWCHLLYSAKITAGQWIAMTLPNKIQNQNKKHYLFISIQWIVVLLGIVIATHGPPVAKITCLNVWTRVVKIKMIPKHLMCLLWNCYSHLRRFRQFSLHILLRRCSVGIAGLNPTWGVTFYLFNFPIFKIQFYSC